MWRRYSVVYLKITKDVVLKHKIDGEIRICFYCSKCDSRIKLGDLVRNTEYLLKKYGEIKPNEKSEEEVEQGEQEDEQNEEELDAMFKELD